MTADPNTVDLSFPLQGAATALPSEHSVGLASASVEVATPTRRLQVCSVRRWRGRAGYHRSQDTRRQMENR